MKKKYLLIIIFLLLIIIITIIGSIVVTGNKEVIKEKDILTMQSNREAYLTGYGYSIDNPNVIVNPYGNSPLTALVMFETGDYDKVSISIKSKDGNSDINYSFESDKYHMIPIYGLYADYNNTVILNCGGYEKIINIQTDKLPEDLLLDNSVLGNFIFYNTNYPYAVDSGGEVRWILNSNYYGDITMLDNSKIIIGSDKYNEDDIVVSLYEMNFLGKVYNEYLLDEYYGMTSKYGDNILVLSDNLLEIDLQSGKIIKNHIINDNYDYLNVVEGKIILGKDGKYYQLLDDKLDDITYSSDYNNYNFYNDTFNYNIVPSNRYGKLSETEVSRENISLIKYKKKMPDGITIIDEANRIKIVNENEDNISLILDKFLDKRVYDVGYIKYVNKSGLSGKYTVYFKVKNKIYKTDYYIEV